MSVVGIDFGNLNTVIAVARKRGVDIIANEASNRLTPSVVSFGPKQRFAGEPAKTLEISNFKNTVSTLKRLAGRSYEDPDIYANEARYINAKLVEDESGEVATEVLYLNEPKTFTFTQLSAAFLTKVKEITQKELNGPVTDVVLSVPGWFSSHQRESIKNAAEIAGLNPLRILNDTTSAALGYGLTKSPEFPDAPTETQKSDPRIVCFIDFGHSNFQVSVVAFYKGQLKVLSSNYTDLGGRQFDQALVDHVVQEFETKYKGLDIRDNKKACYRLRLAAERAKKVLSANSNTVLAVESLVEDRDVSTKLERQDFEALIQPLVDKIIPCIQIALDEAKVTKEQVSKVEIVGGSGRVPLVRRTIAQFFGDDLENSDPLTLKLSSTLNPEEAIARGNALMCAMLSPVFKVRDFGIVDWNAHPVEICWDPKETAEPDEAGILEMFARGDKFPVQKRLTFTKTLKSDDEKLQLTVRYKPEAYSLGKLSSGTDEIVGKWIISGIKAFEQAAEFVNIKVLATLNADGIISLDKAEVWEDVEQEDSMETDQPQEEPPVDKKKKVVKKNPVKIQQLHQIPPHLLQTHRELEATMIVSDKLVVDTEYAKNALEEYVYDARGKLDDQWSNYTTDDIKSSFRKQLDEMEEWLYSEEGEDAQKSVYVEKLSQLKKIGDPISKRHRTYETLPRHLHQLVQHAQDMSLKLSSDQLNHVPEEDLNKAKGECQTKISWAQNVIKTVEERKNSNKLHQDVDVTVEHVDRERETLDKVVHPVLNRPKPKEEKKEEVKEDVKEPSTEEPAEKKEEMEVD